MQLYVLAAIFCFVAVWRRPLVGYGIFLALSTPLVNLMEMLVHPFLGALCCTLATGLLFIRRFGRRHWLPLNWVELACAGLTLIVLVRSIELTEYQGPTSYVYPLFYASLWMPFLLVVHRLDDSEIRMLREMAVFGLFVIGIFSLVGYLTGSARVLELSQTARLNEEFVTGKLSLVEILKNRYQITGIFNYLPYAYWLLLYCFFDKIRITKAQTIYYAITFIGTWSAILISVTRSLLIQMSAGTLLVVLLWWVKRPKQKVANIRRQKVLLASLLFGVLVFWGTGKFDEILISFQGRFTTFGFADKTFMARVEDSRLAWNYLVDTLPLFGSPGPNPRMNYVRVGDPNMAMVVWLYYGLIGLLLFLLIVFTAFHWLARLWRRSDQTMRDPLIIACLTAWGAVYLMQIVIVGNYLQQTDVLFFMWFIAEISRLWRPAKHDVAQEPIREGGLKPGLRTTKIRLNQPFTLPKA